EVDTVQRDHELLPDVEFFLKYSIGTVSPGAEDVRVTKYLWGLKHVRGLAAKQKRRMVSMVLERPGKSKPFYIIGMYDVASRDHYVKVGTYRIDTVLKVVEFLGGRGWEVVE
ncbi:MAG TPA: hypothetical protein VGD65_04010, partial [Chryseosolibacter sp.]